jgi:prepilin-type N-terminal cleavage/methylation domain-containing protein
MRSLSGFTLAELLIALAILGVIATFTIPKVLQSQQNGQKIAIFKETIAAIQQAQDKEQLEGGVTPTTDDMNAIKTCPNNAGTEGCWPQAALGVWPNFNKSSGGGMILANGASVGGLGLSFQDNIVNPSEDIQAITIDWNGATGPNVDGDDQLTLLFCFSKPKCTDAVLGSKDIPYRHLGPAYGDAASIALYNSIFQ